MRCKVVAKLESKAVMMVNVSAMCYQKALQDRATPGAVDCVQLMPAYGKSGTGNTRI